MKAKKLTISIEKNPQQLFEEIENTDLAGISTAEMRRLFDITCNAFEYNINQVEYLIDFCIPSMKMTA